MAGSRERAVEAVSTAQCIAQGLDSCTYLGRRHHVLGLRPLGHLGGRIVVVYAAIGGTVFLPDGSPRLGELPIRAVHREYRVASTSAQVYRRINQKERVCALAVFEMGKAKGYMDARMWRPEHGAASGIRRRG